MSALKIAPGVELPLSIVTQKNAIMAMTGAGKTYLARVMAEEFMEHGAQIIVGDYLGVWHGLQSSASGKREGYPVVIFGGDHADVKITEDAGTVIADAVVKERISAILDVSGWEDDAPKIRFMTAFARRLFHLNERPVHFFLDEADEFVPQNPQREQITMLAVLKRIWQRGRVRGIGGTIISQRPAIVHKSLLTQSEMLVALRTVGPQDRDALEAWFQSWGTADQIKTFKDTISNLPEYHAWFWSPKHNLFVQAKARKATTFDSSRTPDVATEISEPEKRKTPDLSKLDARIRALAEEAKADDPVELRKQLAHYKTQFDTAKKRYVILEERIKKLSKAPAKPVKVPVMDAKALAAFERASANVLKAVESITGEMSEASRTFIGAASAVERQINEAKKLTTLPADDGQSPMAAQFEAGVDDMGSTELAFVSAMDAPRASGGGENDGRRRILIALAQHGAMSTNRLRVIAGIASMHTFRKYLGNLRTVGRVDGNGASVRITDDGRRLLGTYAPLPTGKALIQYWIGELGGGGHAEIFKVLLAKPSYAWPHEELQQAAKVESIHTFRKYLGRLKTLGLASSVGAGATSIAPEFKGL